MTDLPRETASRTRRWRRVYLLPGLLLGTLVLVTLGLGRLRAAAPTIDRATVWIDTVKRGPMIRDIAAPGTLVPEEIRFLSAPAPARVDKILVRPGAEVGAQTVILVLTNPDLELAAMEAERQVASAASDLVNLQANLDSQRLAQQSQLASLSSELGDARRRSQADADLAEKGFLSELERGQSRDRATELAGRLAFEQKRLGALGRGHAAQIAAQRQQVERQRAIATVRQRAVENLQVRAGVAGVLQQLALQVGQSVEAGALLAKVARPDRLKAEIRVPEMQAKDVQLGLPVAVDTRGAIITGKVVRIDPAVQTGFVKIDVAFSGPLPAGARPDLSVAATIELDRLNDVLYVGRPVMGQAGANLALFKLGADGDSATRTPVHLGRTSAKVVEVIAGLAKGDRVILSDLPQWNAADRLQLK